MSNRLYSIMQYRLASIKRLNFSKLVANLLSSCAFVYEKRIKTKLFVWFYGLNKIYFSLSIRKTMLYNIKSCTITTFLYYYMEWRVTWYMIHQYKQMNANDTQWLNMINYSFQITNRKKIICSYKISKSSFYQILVSSWYAM